MRFAAVPNIGAIASVSSMQRTDRARVSPMAERM
jgi:hypothetical protein